MLRNSYILKTYGQNYAKIIIFFDVLSSRSYSFTIITHHFMLKIKILMLIISKNREMHIWTETSYQCCEILYILKIYVPNKARILIFFEVLSSRSYSFTIITH